MGPIFVLALLSSAPQTQCGTYEPVDLELCPFEASAQRLKRYAPPLMPSIRKLSEGYWKYRGELNKENRQAATKVANIVWKWSRDIIDAACGAWDLRDCKTIRRRLPRRSWRTTELVSVLLDASAWPQQSKYSSKRGEPDTFVLTFRRGDIKWRLHCRFGPDLDDGMDGGCWTHLWRGQKEIASLSVHTGRSRFLGYGTITFAQQRFRLQTSHAGGPPLYISRRSSMPYPWPTSWTNYRSTKITNGWQFSFEKTTTKAVRISFAGRGAGTIRILSDSGVDRRLQLWELPANYSLFVGRSKVTSLTLTSTSAQIDDLFAQTSTETQRRSRHREPQARAVGRWANVIGLRLASSSGRKARGTCPSIRLKFAPAGLSKYLYGVLPDGGGQLLEIPDDESSYVSLPTDWCRRKSFEGPTRVYHPDGGTQVWLNKQTRITAMATHNGLDRKSSWKGTIEVDLGSSEQGQKIVTAYATPKPVLLKASGNCSYGEAELVRKKTNRMKVEKKKEE